MKSDYIFCVFTSLPAYLSENFGAFTVTKYGYDANLLNC